MPQEVARIADQVRRSFAGEAWHGPSVADSIEGVDATAAMFRIAPDSHSIAEIVAHLAHIQEIVLARIEGRGRLNDNADCWPPVPNPLSERDWAALRERLRTGAQSLDRAVAAFPQDRLDTPLVKGGSSAYNNFMGHAQHNTYHAGQIMILRRLAGRAATA